MYKENLIKILARTRMPCVARRGRGRDVADAYSTLSANVRRPRLTNLNENDGTVRATGRRTERSSSDTRNKQPLLSLEAAAATAVFRCDVRSLLEVRETSRWTKLELYAGKLRFCGGERKKSHAKYLDWLPSLNDGNRRGYSR